jgi:hypothetical protein
MNANQSRDFAHRSAANIGDPLARAALAEKFRESAALLVGADSGLAAAAPAGKQATPGVSSEIATALLALRMLADRIASGDVFEDEYAVAPARPVSTVYAFTPAQLGDHDTRMWRSGWRACATTVLDQSALALA